MTTPTPEDGYEVRTETAFCSDIKCTARRTVQLQGPDISQDDVDQELRAAGWSDWPFLGQWLCPDHRRGATVRMGAMRDGD